MPSSFERLFYVATLHDPKTSDSRQFHCLGYAGSEVDNALWTEHHLIFEDWLGLTLEQKWADLEEYTSRQGRHLADAANEWFEPMLLDRLIPRAAQPPEVRLFRNDVQLLREIIAGKKSPRS